MKIRLREKFSFDAFTKSEGQIIEFDKIEQIGGDIHFLNANGGVIKSITPFYYEYDIIR